MDSATEYREPFNPQRVRGDRTVGRWVRWCEGNASGEKKKKKIHFGKATATGPLTAKSSLRSLSFKRSHFSFFFFFPFSFFFFLLFSSPVHSFSRQNAWTSGKVRLMSRGARSFRSFYDLGESFVWKLEFRDGGSFGEEFAYGVGCSGSFVCREIWRYFVFFL